MMANFKFHKQYRLPYYNYASTGLYFITICTFNKTPLFGRIEQGILHISDIGNIVEHCWSRIPISSPYAAPDSFVLMLDHIHGIIEVDNSGAKLDIPAKAFSPQRQSISIVIRNFKAAVTTRAREIDPCIRIWQSRFFDRVIRNETELNAIRKYIMNNPIQWDADKYSEDRIS